MIPKDQKYFEKSDIVRENIILPERHEKSLNCKSKQDKGMTLNNLKIMKNSAKFETNSASWITGDVSRFDFNDELVDEDESQKRLICMFFIIALILLTIANILAIQYSTLV